MSYSRKVDWLSVKKVEKLKTLPLMTMHHYNAINNCLQRMTLSKNKSNAMLKTESLHLTSWASGIKITKLFFLCSHDSSSLPFFIYKDTLKLSLKIYIRHRIIRCQHVNCEHVVLTAPRITECCRIIFPGAHCWAHLTVDWKVWLW